VAESIDAGRTHELPGLADLCAELTIGVLR
jgi:hypothetical protein